MKRVRYTNLAREDLLDIWVHIAPHDQQAADRVYDRIGERCQLLRECPADGTCPSGHCRGRTRLVIKRWIALYRVTEDGVQIVRVANAAQDLSKLEWPPPEFDE